MYNSYNYNSPANHSSKEPDESALIGLIQHLNKNELSELLENETKLIEMVCDNAQIKAMRTNKETIEARVKSLAEYNMNKKPLIEEKKSILKQLHKDVNDAREQYDIARVKYDSLDTVSPEVIVALLQASMAEIEEKSEATASSFLDGDLDCDKFMTRFRSERKLAHQRRIRSEKMTELAVNAPQAARQAAPPVTTSAVAPSVARPSMAMPASGPPPLPPRNYTVGGPPPFNHEAPTTQLPFPTRPPVSAAANPPGYWGQPSMPMPQPFGAPPPPQAQGMYGAVGGGYHYFNQ